MKKFISFVLTLSILTGCREVEINAIEEAEEAYAIYGALNITETKHIIRIRDLNVVHGDTTSASLNATVTFKDLQTGTSQILRDSVVQFPAGNTHNFILEKELLPRSTYQVTVDGVDGKSASSIFTTPGVPNVRILPIGAPIDCVRNMNIQFNNVLASEIIRWRVGFTFQNKLHTLELSRFCSTERYEESTQQFIVETTPLFMLDKVFPQPNSVFTGCDDIPSPAVRCNDLDTNEVQIIYFHLGPEWNKVFPLYPTDPQDIQAIANGLGFLGAYYEGIATFLVD